MFGAMTFFGDSGDEVPKLEGFVWEISQRG